MGSLRLFVSSSMRPERLCALTDGVYAIVLTLLVLDLKPPEEATLTNSELVQDLVALGPNLLAYLISFVVVSFFWMQHHRVFASLERCDGRALLGNFLHLLLISLTPFTASLIGRYEGERAATILFSLLLGLASLTGSVLARYVTGQKDWHAPDVPGEWVTLPAWAPWFAPLLAAASIALAFANPAAALLLWLLLPVRELLVLRRVR